MFSRTDRLSEHAAAFGDKSDAGANDSGGILAGNVRAVKLEWSRALGLTSPAMALERCGFTGAVCADQGDDLTAGNIKEICP